MSIVFIKNQSHLKLYKLCRMFLISPVSEPFWSIAAKEAKKQCTGAAMTLAQRAELSDAKILLGVKYYLAQNIYIWYLVTDISGVNILFSHGSERNNASEQQRHLHNEQRRLNNRLHNNIRWKNLARKNIIWWCGKLSTTGCTATSETPVLPALQLAPCTTCSAQQI